MSHRECSAHVYENQKLKNMLSSEFKSDTNATANHLKILYELQRMLSLHL